MPALQPGAVPLLLLLRQRGSGWSRRRRRGLLRNAAAATGLFFLVPGANLVVVGCHFLRSFHFSLSLHLRRLPSKRHVREEKARASVRVGGRDRGVRSLTRRQCPAYLLQEVMLFVLFFFVVLAAPLPVQGRQAPHSGETCYICKKTNKRNNGHWERVLADYKRLLTRQ